MLSVGIWCSLTQLYPLNLAQILGLWVTCGVKSQNDVIVSWLTLTATPQTASRIHIRHIESV
jgi:hypothetical protein